MIILYIFLAIAILLLMVLIHEFGHYCIGRMLNFKITEFSIGFGKAIFSRKNKRGELISLRIFPLGGYCAFAGEDETDSNKEDAFTNQKPWKRILVFLAGVTFNFATAVIFSMILLCTVGYDIPQVSTNFNMANTAIYDVYGNEIKKDTIIPDSAVTYLNGYDPNQILQPGDVIISINGEKIDFAYGSLYGDLRTTEFNNMLSYMQNAKKEADDNNQVFDPVTAFQNYTPQTTAVVKRNGEYVKDVYLGFYQVAVQVPVRDDNGNVIEGQYTTEYRYCFDSQVKTYVHTFWEAVERAVPFAFGLAWIVLKSLWLLITFQLPLSAIGGPVTTIATIATTTQTNFANILLLIPLISANLAIFNALPIPALDGAHVLFTTIEAIRKKPIKRETENMIHAIGLFILFGFVILVDILHFLL